jgi:Spy/CpxP family protein refolding chaperone
MDGDRSFATRERERQPMTRLIVITGFVVAFFAGVMSGVAWNWHGPQKPGDDRRGGRESWIADQLSLTPEQQKQMKDIWPDVGRRGSGRDKRNQIRKEQDEAVAALVRPEDKPVYDKIILESRQKTEAIEADNRKAFQQAVEKTKAILTPEQRTKYEELLARLPGGPGRENREHDRPATQAGHP